MVAPPEMLTDWTALVQQNLLHLGSCRGLSGLSSHNWVDSLNAIEVNWRKGSYDLVAQSLSIGQSRLSLLRIETDCAEEHKR